MSDREQFEAARAAGLKARHETRVERAIRRAIINAEWKAQADDMVDGWCVLDATSTGTPATGNVPIAHFCHAEAARHMAVLHNLWLAHQGYLPIPATIESTVRTQVAEEIAWAITEAGDKRSPDRHSASEEKRDHGSTRYASYLDAARIAREIGAKETS